MQLVVKDDELEISKALKFLLEDHGVAIITQGLGPNRDDKTIKSIVYPFSLPLVLNKKSWKDMHKKLCTSNSIEKNLCRKQYFFPQGCTNIINGMGTASSCHLKIKKNIFSLFQDLIENVLLCSTIM